MLNISSISRRILKADIKAVEDYYDYKEDRLQVEIMSNKREAKLNKQYKNLYTVINKNSASINPEKTGVTRLSDKKYHTRYKLTDK